MIEEGTERIEAQEKDEERLIYLPKSQSLRMAVSGSTKRF